MELPATDWEEVRRKLGDRLGKNEWLILEKIWANPAVSISEMAEQIGISTTAVENNINKLKSKDMLEGIGTA